MSQSIEERGLNLFNHEVPSLHYDTSDCLTCKRHEDITVLCGHRFHPRLMRHDVSPCLQQPLSKQLV